MGAALRSDGIAKALVRQSKRHYRSMHALHSQGTHRGAKRIVSACQAIIE